MITDMPAAVLVAPESQLQALLRLAQEEHRRFVSLSPKKKLEVARADLKRFGLLEDAVAIPAHGARVAFKHGKRAIGTHRKVRAKA